MKPTIYPVQTAVAAPLQRRPRALQNGGDKQPSASGYNVVQRLLQRPLHGGAI